MTADASAFGQASNAAPGDARTVKLRDGRSVPALGQGSARLAHGRHPQAEEEAALRTGIDLGMTLIDTAELYGSEELIGRVIAGQRDRVFLVSKVWQSHVAGDGIAHACAASLKRLGTDRLDLYLLHWPNGVSDFAHVVKAFEDLQAAGKIRAWGVSNFKVGDMEKLFRVPQGDRCAMNQVPYSLDDRAIERDLLAWCERHEVPVMAYSPLGGPGAALLRNPAAGTHRRSTQMLAGRGGAGLDHTQRPRHRDSGIGLGRACEGECGGAVADAHAAGPERSRRRVSTARTLKRHFCVELRSTRERDGCASRHFGVRTLLKTDGIMRKTTAA